MKSKVLLTVVAALALLLVWVPSASAKVKWAYGNGQHDISLNATSTGAVCSTLVSGRAGLGSSAPVPTSWPDAGIRVELYWGTQIDGGWEHSGGQLVKKDFDENGNLVVVDSLNPQQYQVTSTPTALNPLEEYTDFSGDAIFEYAAAPFEFSIPAGIPPGSTIVVAKGTSGPYDITGAVDCSSSATTTTVSSSTNPSNVGDTVTFTAAVTQQDAAPVTQGGVDFSIDGRDVALNVPLVAGQAQYTTSIFSLGDHQDGSYRVSADYLGATDIPSSVGNTLTQVVENSSDSTPPTLSPSLAPGSSFALGQPAPLVTPGAEDAGSGVASASCTGVDTSTTGVRSVTCSATDNAGNTATESRSYTVTSAFQGFRYPTPTSVLGRGWTIPVKFSLGNFQGTKRVTDASVRLTVTATGQQPAPPFSANACSCKVVSGRYVCLLKLPSKPGSYQIRAWQNLGSASNPAYSVVQNASAVVGSATSNPMTITIR